MTELLMLWGLIAPAVVYFVRGWFDGRPMAEASIMAKLLEHEQWSRAEHAAFMSEHRSFREIHHTHDVRIARIEVQLPTLVNRLDELKAGISDIQKQLREHIQTEEDWRRDLSEFMGKMEQHLQQEKR